MTDQAIVFEKAFQETIEQQEVVVLLVPIRDALFINLLCLLLIRRVPGMICCLVARAKLISCRPMSRAMFVSTTAIVLRSCGEKKDLV